MQQHHVVAMILGIVFLVCGVGMLVDKVALRDLGKDRHSACPRPYSLSRVQLWWWTMIVLGALIGLYGWSGRVASMTETCLALLGISLATTVSGRIVDQRQIEDPKIERHQDIYRSEGLFRDIVSDENGPSVHRFQTVTLNIFYGVWFVERVASDTSFPTFDGTTLTLLGVSAAAYVAVKTTESTAGTAAPVEVAVVTATVATAGVAVGDVQRSDELLDPGPFEEEADD
jgi:hypothetical protein